MKPMIPDIDKLDKELKMAYDKLDKAKDKHLRNSKE